MVMPANINAIGIIVALLSAILALIKWGEKPKSIKRIIAGISCGIFIALISVTISFHACLNGQPFLQWLIPSIGSCLIIIFIKKKLQLIFLVSIMITSSLFLSLQYAHLVHSDHYIGVPSHTIPIANGHNIKKIDTIKLWHTSFSRLYGIKQTEDKD